MTDFWIFRESTLMKFWRRLSLDIIFKFKNESNFFNKTLDMKHFNNNTFSHAFV